MSTTKGVVIDGLLCWVWSDTHDVVLAQMVAVGESLEWVPREWTESWRVCACVSDLAFATAERPNDEDRQILGQVLDLTRDLAGQRGDVTGAQVSQWRLGEDLVVCGGALFSDPVTLRQQWAVIDTYLELLSPGIHEAPFGTIGAPGPPPS